MSRAQTLQADFWLDDICQWGGAMKLIDQKVNNIICIESRKIWLPVYKREEDIFKFIRLPIFNVLMKIIYKVISLCLFLPFWRDQDF